MNNYIFTIFSLLFLASSLVSFFVAFAAWQRKRERGAVELALLMLFAGLWAFLVIFETASTTLVGKIFWSKAAYIGALSTPALFLMFVLRITGRDKYLNKRAILGLFVSPVIVFILALTNEYHHLIWTGFAPISGVTNLTTYYHGVVFWIGYFGYSYLLLIISSVFLFKFLVSRASPFKSQAKAIFVALLCPWLASILYVSDSNPIPGFDLVPLSMIISGTMLAIAVFRSKLLDLTPVARETLLETLEDGILVLDRYNRVQDINNSAVIHLGIDKKNIIGQDFKSIKSAVKAIANAVLNEFTNQMIQVKYAGDIKHFNITKQEIKNYPGSKLVIIRDKTSEINREHELLIEKGRAQESDRLKSSFVANLSHEIRTPINVITGFLDILNQKDIDEKDQAIYVDLLKKSTDRILNTLNDIIEISKIEAGQAKLTETQINLNEIIDYLYNIFIKDAQTKGLTINFEKGIDDKSALIIVDRPKLVTIFSNLIKNSLKFTDKGKIDFGYKLNDDKLLFYVKDTGIGIPSGRKEMIFNRFVQAEQTMNRPYEGAGLGLSIVKAYVDMLGGEVILDSVVGEGSTFSFSINYKPVIFPSNID
ncbi:MAG: histidine kinase N-terminal 7TM domain-containing protein [Bacteroidales bacterium]|nr:histidine kinase N-terminal 7TM domain-containing protein [Bacteroidales bacterium]